MKNRSVVAARRLLLAVALASGVAGCSTDDVEERGTRILMVGNSFSISLLQHLPQLASSCGEDLDLASLSINGCSFEQHWKNAERDGDADFKPYAFGRNRFGKVTQGRANICDALRLAKWDIVTIQQASGESCEPESYRKYGPKLIARIRELAPQAKIYVQETWSYTPWDRRLAEWGISQKKMYGLLHAAYAEFASEQGIGIIPFGTAVQKWRKRLPVKYTENSLGGDVVGGRWQDPKDHFRQNATGEWVPNCDVVHLNLKGEYFQALVWLKTLFADVDISNLSSRPDGVTESEDRLMREIATEFAQ